MQLESNRLDDVEATLDAAMKFLEAVPDGEKASLVIELEAIRTAFAGMLKPADRTKISAGEGKVRQAKSQIESGYKADDIEVTLRAAEAFLDGLADVHKAPVLAQIAAVRASLGAVAPQPSPPPRAPVVDDRASGARAPEPPRTTAPVTAPAPAPAPTPTPTAAPAAALSDDAARDLSRGKSRVFQATTLLESRQIDRVEGTLQEALEFLAGVPDSYKANLVAEIATIRAKLAAASHGEDVRKITSMLERDLGAADSSITVNTHHTTQLLAHVAEILAADETRRVLSAGDIAGYQSRADATATKLAASIKADALARAQPILDDLEQRVATDPFVGLDQRAAYVATNELRYLHGRIRMSLSRVPDDDDTRAIQARLAAVDVKIDAASAAWGKAVLDAQVGSDWNAIVADIDGWELEAIAADARPLDEPRLQKTRLAIQRIRYLLDDPGTHKIRDDNKGDPTIEGTYRAAEQTFEAAAAKLDAAFNSVLDHADTMATPLSRFDLDRPAQLAHAAEYSFKGTRFVDANVSRARRLDERWKAEVAAIMKTRQELYDKLAAEADARWPGIVDATKPAAFDPATATPGAIVLLEGVYNRSGWDFDGGDYNFAMRFDGIPVGANYDSHVRAALEHAWYELKLEVSDWIAWDAIAVVEGWGSIGVRTTISLRSKDTGLEIGKLEEFRPAECVKLRIVGLRAGPVAVAPP